MTAVERTPIVANVLTGFLGSGKTTLLNSLLREPDLSDTAVIINEFGDIGIDHMLVETIEDDMVLLRSGCICCTIRGDLKDAILSLFEKRNAGLISPFTRLVIETTGLADPAPIVATLTADLMLKYHFTMGNIITVVDAVNGRHNIETFAESARQIAVADRILVTKSDLAGLSETAVLTARLCAMNPAAPVEVVDPRQGAKSLIVTENIHDLGARTAEARRWIAAERYHDHAHAAQLDVNRHGGIGAISVTSGQALSWTRFSTWLSMLVSRHGDHILRMKGVLSIEGIDTPVAVHGVQHLIHRPVHLSEWPAGLRESVLVFIVEGEIGDIGQSFSVFVERAASPYRWYAGCDCHIGD